MADTRKLQAEQTSAHACDGDLSSASIAADKESACPLCNSSFGTEQEPRQGRSSLLSQISIELIDSHPKTILDRLVDFLAECISDLEHHVSSKLAAQESEEELEEELARLARAKKLQTEAIDLQRSLLESGGPFVQEQSLHEEKKPRLEDLEEKLQLTQIQDIHTRALKLHEVCEVLDDQESELKQV